MRRVPNTDEMQVSRLLRPLAHGETGLHTRQPILGVALGRRRMILAFVVARVVAWMRRAGGMRPVRRGVGTVCRSIGRNSARRRHVSVPVPREMGAVDLAWEIPST
jgi:hypothetical protein